jgi:ribosome-binding protein aMBF1 (putative translation factor)
METKDNLKSFSQHLDERYGEIGTEKRADFEVKAKDYAVGEMIREERKLAKITQGDLARRIGAKKSFISC